MDAEIAENSSELVDAEKNKQLAKCLVPADIKIFKLNSLALDTNLNTLIHFSLLKYFHSLLKIKSLLHYITNVILL